MGIKILHIINDLSLNGGAQKFVFDLANRPPEPFEIRVLTLEPTNDYCARLEQGGITCHNWQDLTLKQKWQMLRWPDIVHGHLYPSIYLSLAALGKRRIQTEHASHNRRRDHVWLRPLETWLYWRYDLTVCISEQVKSELEAFMPWFRRHYRVIYNGVNLDDFPLVAKQPPAPKDSVVNIGMVGRFHRYKDHPALISAMALLPARFELHLAGDGNTREEMEALAVSLGVDSRVHFHGVVSDIPAFLSGLQLYVQSANVEGFGLAAVEAMAAGLPVIGSLVPGLDEIVGNPLYLFELGDSRQLADKLIALCQPSAYTAAAQYSVDRCQHFTLDQFRDSYYQTYRRLADGNATG